MKKFYAVSRKLSLLTSTGLFRKICVVVLGMFMVNQAQSQQVTLTATGGVVSGTYQRLEQAFTAINAGTHRGVINISINATTAETGTASLDNSGTGLASYTSVNISPTANNVIVAGNIPGSLVKLNGADNVTINGFFGGTRQLTFNNTSTNTSAIVMHIASPDGSDGANNNIIRNCIIRGTSSSIAGLLQGNGPIATSAPSFPNSNNIYENNVVSSCFNGMVIFGPASGSETGNQIIKNQVGSTVPADKIGLKAIQVIHQTDLVISENIIAGVNSTAGSATAQASGIDVRGVINGGRIDRNNISDIKMASFWGSNGIQLGASNAATNLSIENNFIYDVASGGWTSNANIDDNGQGIAIATGGSYLILHNSINMTTNQNSGTGSALWLSTSTTITNLDVRNNIFSNQQTANSRFAIYSNRPASAFATINYNDYFSTGANIGFLTSNRATLADWQTATSQDANSLSLNPSFFSATDLHLFFNSPLNDLGVGIPSVTRDIDNDARNASTPDIGADEFTPPNCTGNNGGTATVSVTEICASGSATLSSTGFSFGIGIAYQWEFFDGVSWQPIPGAINASSANTGTITATTQFRLRVTCNAGAPGYSNTVSVTVNNPVPLTTTPNSRCGVGTVNLAATGTNLKWYNVPTGGTAIGTGPAFTTPVISATTTYYVSASAGGTSGAGGATNSGTGAYVSFNDAGLVFTAAVDFTLVSVKMYPDAAGSVNVAVQTSAGVTIPGCTALLTFTGAAPTGVVMPLNFNIPAGVGHRLVTTSTPTCGLFRDAGGSFPFSLGAFGSITGGYFLGPLNNYYHFYDWQMTSACEGIRVPVVATVTAPPAITPSATPAVICSGTSVALNVTSGNAGYTYVWNPGNLSGAAQTVNPTDNITYTVTATDNSAGPNNGCVTTGTSTVTVNNTPTALTINPAVSDVCANQTITITASGGNIPNQTIFLQQFESFPLGNMTVGGTGVTASQNTIYYQQGTSSLWLTHGDNVADGHIATSSMNLSLFTNPVLNFSHIAALESPLTTFDRGLVEYSTNGGGSWTTFPASSYTGSGTLIGGADVIFSTRSYPDWITQFNNSSATPGTGPATSLWKQESINLTPWQASTNFRIRFRITSDVSVQYYGWLIDNVRLSGTGQAPITWSGVPAGELYISVGPNVLYSGQNSNIVYSIPTVSHVYTATATGGAGCNTTATSNLTVSSVAVGLSIAANPGNNICAGTSVTFTATAVNGGTNPFYTWFLNGSNVLSGAFVNTYTNNTLSNGDFVTCTVSSNLGCATNNPATSNMITMTVNPIPTVNITGANTVCNGAPPTVLTANASVTPGSIVSYEWFIGGVSQGAPSPVSTFNATLPGTYTVRVLSAAGCPQTSAPFVVTLPTYTITATAGPNGTISPSGSVVVNCGDNQTFTITPNGGYSIQDVLVDAVSVGPVGTYTFTNVTGPHTISATFFISGCINPPTANAGANNSFCANASYTLNGSVGGSATAGTWSGGGGTFNPNANTLNAIYTPSAAEIAAGTVTLTLTSNNPAGAPCIPSISTVTLTIKEIPSVNITGTLGFCPSSSTTLTANASINPPGPITYAWLFNGVTPLGTSATQASSSGAGNYQVTATGNGCSNTANVNVVAFVPATVTISGPTVICTNSQAILIADVVLGSGTVPANGYQWFRNTIAIVGATTSVLATSTTGDYTVQVTDINGCVSAISPIHTLTNDNSPLSGIYTISSAPASCTNYISFASAINDLNLRTISGNTRFLVEPGFVETAPSGGLILGSAALNPTLAGRTLSFEKSGVGANPLINSYGGGTTQPASNAPNGMWILQGVDNVTISQIDLNDVNTTGNPLMEYGYGLFKLSTSDGSQNNTIINCTITLKKENNLGAGTLMPAGSAGIVVMNATYTAANTALTPISAAGTNSNNNFLGNTIQNCNTGIALFGHPASAPYTLGDVNNNIGGITSLTGNNIVNFGGGGSNPAAGVIINNQFGLNVSYNTINNNIGAPGADHQGQLRGVYGVLGVGASITIANNAITLKSNAPTLAIAGIENAVGSSGSGNTVNISDNVIALNHNAATNGTFTGISNAATATNITINNNTLQNCLHTGTGIWTGISSNTGATSVATLSMSNNTLFNNIIVSTGTFIGIGNSGTAVTNLTMNGNLVRSNSKVTATAINFISTGSTGTTNNVVANSNILRNNLIRTATTGLTHTGLLTGNAAYTADGNVVDTLSVEATASIAATTIRAIGNGAATPSETISNNKIKRVFITGTYTGTAGVVGIASNTGTATSIKNIFNNEVDTLYAPSGVSANITAIQSLNAVELNIYKNKISHIIPGQNGAVGSIARGILLQSLGANGVANIHNNMINMDLTQAFSPAANSRLVASDAVRGIDITAGISGTSSLNLYYNTVRVAGAGSGASFGSSALSFQSATPPTTIMRNNIFSNVSTPGGTSPGFAVAVRRNGAGVVGYASTSNNNLFYAGTPGASRLLYFNGTNAYQTLTDYQGGAGISPRETNSLSFAPPFVSATDLHINPAAGCDLDGAGTPIAGAAFAKDIDEDDRDTVLPDIGADEFTGSGGSPIWKGVSTNWNDLNNWCGIVPTTATNVIIPAGRPNYPVITVANAVTNNISIATGATVTVSGSGKLAIYGSITNTGSFNVSDGTIEMAGSSAQTIPASVFVGNNIKNLIINNATVNLAGDLNLLNKLSFTGSNRTFATAGFLTMKSTATRTASLLDITNAGANSGNQVTGDVTVERFITARRAWRLLSVPSQNNLQTIKQAWQENQAANATTPAGFGIQIPSDRASWAGDGFDIYTPTGGPSVKTYNPATNQWEGIISTVNVVTPTPSNGRFVTGRAYMTFIRGDRTVNTFPSAATTTVLREKGALVTGSFGPIAVGAGQFAAIGNPYASAVDFTQLTRSNLQDVYYLWDPYLGTLGGYQTFLGPGYTAVPGGGSYTSGNKLIESGSAFFVRAPGPAGSLTFTEPSKADTNFLVQRLTGPEQFLRTNLYQVPAGGTERILTDGVLNRFDDSYTDALDENDAVKLGNFGENIGLSRAGKLLVAESRSGLVASDTIYYQLGQMRAQSYQFEFIPENLGQYGLEAFLEDRFTNTKTPVSLSGNTAIPFNIVNEAGSYAADRFMLVFKQLAPVPVSFTSVKAEKVSNDIMVSWKVESESAIDHYEVEESADGRRFTKIGERIATGNNGSMVEYNWLDRQVINGYNYYRIRSVGFSGETKYSEIVKINISEITPPLITVYPNPVREDGNIQVSMNNVDAGNYVISVYNELGQLAYRKQINHAGNNSVYTINLGKVIAHGQYTLDLTGEKAGKKTFKIIY